MSIGIFTDKNHKPLESEISDIIGPMKNTWVSLIDFIRGNYKVNDQMKYMYGQKYGWALRFEIRSKLFTALYPSNKGFIIQIILSPDVIEKAIQTKLSKNITKAIESAHPYPEGRWLFIQVESENDIQGIKQLLDMKKDKLFNNKKTLKQNRSSGKIKSVELKDSFDECRLKS